MFSELALHFAIAGRRFRAQLQQGQDLSIPVRFSGARLRLFGVPPPSARPFETGRLVGDTRRGGSCNFEELRFVPHCTATHTEGVGHIAEARIAVNDLLQQPFFTAWLVSLAPQPAAACRESYQPAPAPADRLLPRDALAPVLAAVPWELAQALVIRTLPNSPEKKTRDYDRQPAAYFTNEAMQEIARCGLQHLLVDLPSIDRQDDEGRLSNHHIFWDVPQGSHEVDAKNCSRRTITELIYVPDTLPDGFYLLHLQTANFDGDAVPSRPMLYPIHERT